MVYCEECERFHALNARCLKPGERVAAATFPVYWSNAGDEYVAIEAIDAYLGLTEPARA